MDNTVLNGLQLYRARWSSDLLDEATIADMFQYEPHKVSTVLSYIFGRYESNTLDFLTMGLGKTMTVESREYEWPVMIDNDRAIPIVRAEYNGSAVDTSSSSTDTPGIAGTPIKLWLEEKWFGPGAILAFDDRDYQVRISGEPYADGDAWVYTVYVVGNETGDYIDPTLLAAGKQVSREGSAYEEYSEEADIVNYESPFKLRNQLTTMRLSYDITGSAYSSAMVIEMKGPNGKKTRMWAPYQEWIALRQWYETLDRFAVYSKYNTNSNGVTALKGTNGRPVYIGAGILEQISPSNRQTYTELTTDTLDTFLFDLSYNLLGKNERKFVALTGEMGMREFDRVLKEKASGYTLVDSKFVSGSGQELTLGGQFTTYKMLNGIELTLKHFPAYDNTTYNRKLHPITKKPLESYRMTFIDFASRDGEANLRKVVRKDREFSMWHTAGSVAPNSGHSKSTSVLRSNAKDGYSVHFLSETGYMLADPTTSGELILDVE